MAVPIEGAVRRVREAPSWDERVEEVRRIPEVFGQQHHRAVYAAIAEEVYVPNLAAQFAYVLWPEDYRIEPFEETYRLAHDLTRGFTGVEPGDLARCLRRAPRTLRVFRAIIGYTPGEFEEAAKEAARILDLGTPRIAVKGMEAGREPTAHASEACAEAIHRLMTGTMWDAPLGDFRSKIEKPDTAYGWDSVRRFAAEGVPYSTLLHQRHYGGAFRTLLDATSTGRGDILEVPLEQLLQAERVPYIRTGSANQGEIADRFNLTVRPAPDFVIYEPPRVLRALIECKQTNDGGTARDKAARFRTLADEGGRLGGVPVFAVLDGLGWRRTADALGPVVRDTDGRVFTVETLPEILTVQPFPGLRGRAPE